jgi:hypothetical protein
LPFRVLILVVRHFNQACRAADEENTIVSFLSYVSRIDTNLIINIYCISIHILINIYMFQVKGEGKSGFSSKLPEYKQRKTFCQEHPVVEHVIEENEVRT